MPKKKVKTKTVVRNKSKKTHSDSTTSTTSTTTTLSWIEYERWKNDWDSLVVEQSQNPIIGYLLIILILMVLLGISFRYV